MLVTFQQMAPDGSRFAPGCFDGAVASGALAGAVVSPDGTSAELTADVPATHWEPVISGGELTGVSLGPFKARRQLSLPAGVRPHLPAVGPRRR